MIRRLTAVVAALVLAAAALPVVAVVNVYTFVAVPLTVVADQTTSFQMTLTNTLGLADIGCLEVDLPAEYEIYEVSDPVASNGSNWSSTWDGNTVIVHANRGGGRLRMLESLTFTITARPKEAGVTSWPNHAHESHNCDDGEQIGLPVEVVVVPQLLPTPSPTPTATPKPTPTATPKPTPKPTPIPTPVPTARVTPLPRPVVVTTPAPVPSATPDASRSSAPSVPASESPRPASPVAPDAVVPGSGGSSSGSADRVRIPFEDDRGASLAVAIGDVLAGAAVFAVPMAVLGGPGLLIILWVALQTLGALSWIPAVRRLRGSEPPRA